MGDNTQFEKSLKLMKLCLFLSGINVYKMQWHPTLEFVFNSLLYYFNLVLLYSVVFAEICWLIDHIVAGEDFVEMSLIAPCVTICFLATLKIVPLYFKKDTLCEILNTLTEIHPKEEEAGITGKIKNKQKENECVDIRNDLKNNNDIGMKDVLNSNEKQKKDRELAKESSRLLKVAAFLLTTISGSVLVTFLLAPLVFIYYEYFKTGEIKVRYPFPVKYWFDIHKVKFWPLVYLQQVWATFIVCINVLGTEILFYSLCTYIEMHFHILCHKLEGIQPGLRTREKLMAGIKRHQLLIHLVEKTEELFSQSILFHFVSSSFLICLSAFNITVAKEMISVFAFVSFLLLSLSQVSLLCYFGDKLMQSSTEVSGAIYNCPWYYFNKHEKKAVFIIIIRSQKACKLTASNFADLNLKAFTTILSRSWSYFALLKTVYK